MDVKEFWDSRAHLGERAGTQDLILHRLEVEAIAKHIRDGMAVLDVGCGNGSTAIELVSRFNVTVTGFDYSNEMIQAAKAAAQQADIDETRVGFAIADVLNFQPGLGLAPYDLIYTKRCLINLPDWPSQKRAIRNILGLLRPGGTYLMVESSQDGLGKLNELRRAVGFDDIVPPWHNRYIREPELNRAILEEEFGCVGHLVIPFTATYYFLSRVINAWLAAQEGKEPSYDASINQLALSLPAIGDCAQTKMWIWRKAG